MDLKKCGALIAQRRRELGLTQKDLANRLQITDKAISRWETGKGFPESSLLQPLAESLGLSITEIVNGERTMPETAAKQADDALLTALAYTKRMKDPVLGVILLTVGALFALAPMYVVGVPTILLWGISALCLVWGVMQYWGNWPSRKVARWIAVGLMTLALILQTVRGSSVLCFAGPDYRYVKYYSCFHFGMLLGYAMFPPVISAVMNVINVIMGLFMVIGKKEGLRDKLFVSTIISACFMALPLFLFGQDYLTLLGFLIVLLMMFSAIFQSRANS